MYSGRPPLPPGWSQHIGPNGQPYYFNAASGQSTHAHPATFAPSTSSAPASSSTQSKPKKEKPKQKDPIPDAPGWLRVTTNLGNVFYTHTETKRSEWTVPEEIREAVEAMERAEKGEESSRSGSSEKDENGSSEVDGQQQNSPAPVIVEEQAEEDVAEQAVEPAMAPADSKRKRQDQEASEDQEPGIDAADLLGSGDQNGSDDEDQPDSKRLRGDEDDEDEADDGEEEDEETDWQTRMAEEMAAEAAGQTNHLKSPDSLDTLDKPPLPAAPPQPPLPPSNSFQSMPSPPPGGYTGPPPGFSPPAPQPALSREEGMALFKHMLSALNDTPQEINPMAPWDAELPKFVHKSEYAALPTSQERQDAFNEWCRDRLRQKREQKKNGSAKAGASGTAGSSAAGPSSPSSKAPAQSSATALEVYQNLLTENVKSTRSRFDEFRKEFKKDRRFYGFGRDDKEREKHFKNHLKELGEQKRKAAEAAEEEFKALLEECAGVMKVAQGGDWRKQSDRELKERLWPTVKKYDSMEKRKEYDAVGSSSRRAELFVQWARSPIPDDVTGIKITRVPSTASSSHVGEEAEARSRQEKALQSRQEKVRRQQMETDQANRKALAYSHREEAAIQFSQLLIDRVKDPLTSFEEVTDKLKGDPRWGGSKMNSFTRQNLLAEHIEKLMGKKKDSLYKIFQRLAPSLEDAKEEIILPLVRHDFEYERLRLDEFLEQEEGGLSSEWKKWLRQREHQARLDFDQMLKENSFLDFWGRLKAEAQRKNEAQEDQAKKALELDVKNQTEEEEEEASRTTLVEMANQVDLEEIHSVLRGDTRYRAWKHLPEKREEWIRSYLEGLGGRKQTVFQQ